MKKLLDLLTNRFAAPPLTRRRIALALIVAVVADGLQIPLAIPPAPEIIDVIAAVFTVCLLGFHLLLLPTFLLEFIPGVDWLPTWTGCVIAVIALRKRGQRAQPPVLPALPDKSIPSVDSDI